MPRNNVPPIIVIAHNIRSAHNVGSIFRTCDGLGVEKIYLTGYTPYPFTANDTRLPHIAEKLTKQINKTALGAEKSVNFEFLDDIDTIIDRLRAEDNLIVGLEQNRKSKPIDEFKLNKRAALILGEEVNGLTQKIIDQCDEILEIPMQGQKESFNVSVAAGIALYALSI